jgi:hypothetical protein
MVLLMAKPNWIPRLEDVLGHKTQETTKVSARTGKEYKTDVIPVLNVLSTGLVEDMGDGKYRYSIVDRQQNLEYAIKVPTKIDVKFGTALSFTNVCGGTTNFGGWYSADSVSIIQRNA